MTLREWLPREFFGEYMDTRTAKFLDWNVIDDIRYDHIDYHSCPIKMKNIYHWCKISDGIKVYAVAWNENPSRGWSFPIKKIK